MANKAKIAIACLLLFGAIAVDFANKLMSVGFDMFFIVVAVWVILPILKSGFEDES